MSGMLKSNRSSDATYIGQTDDWNAALEEDLAAVFGVPIDTAITSPIFTDGYAYSGYAVKSTGKIAGVLRFLTETADYDLAAGTEFEHGSDKFKVACYNGHLVVFMWDTDHWDTVMNLDEGVGSFLALSDTPDTYLPADALKFVRVNATFDGLEFADSGAVPVSLEDLDDVPPYSGNQNKYLHLNAITATPEWTAATPGTVSKFTDLDDVYPKTAGFPINDAAQEGYNILGVSKQGSDPNYTLQWGEPMFGSFTSHEPNYICDSYTVPEEITWDYFAGFKSGGTSSPFLLIDGGRIVIPKYRPGIYLVELWWNCSSDGSNPDGANGGLIWMQSGGLPLEGYAQKGLFTHHSVVMDPGTGMWGVSYIPKVDQITSQFVLHPSAVSTGNCNIMFYAQKNYGSNTVHIDGVRLTITKVA